MNFAQDGLDAQSNQIAYLKWLHSVRPKLYSQVIATAERGGPLQGRGGLANQGAGLEGTSAANAAYNELNGDDGFYNTPGVGQLGWINFLVQAIATVGSAVMQKKQIDKQVDLQKKALKVSDAQATADRTQAAKFKLLEVNTARAQAGLPPVDLAGNLVNTDALRMPITLAPYTVNGVPVTSRATFIPGVPNTVAYVGGGLLGLALLRTLKVI
jgi:hypothetical protein